MLLSELEYITQKNIDESLINVTSADAYSEAREYNIYAYGMYGRKRRIQIEFLSWTLIQFCLVFLSVFILLSTRSFSSDKLLVLKLIAAAIYIFMYVYFIIIKKIRTLKMNLIVSAILVIVGVLPVYPVIAANALIGRTYEKFMKEASEQAGYPHFAQLKITYIRDAESAEDGVMEDTAEAEEKKEENPFDKFRIRPEDDNGMLKNNDINDI